MKIKDFLTSVLIGAGALCGQTPTTPQFYVLNATSYQPSLSRGVVAVILGEGLTPPDQIGCVFSDEFGWTRDLEGVLVRVNQKPAPIASHCRLPLAGGLTMELLTCQFPMDLAPGEAEVVVWVNGLASSPLKVTLQSYAPALAEFFTQGGQKLGAIRHTDSGKLVTAVAPAFPGEMLSIVANGLGPTNPLVPEGQITPPSSPATVTPAVVEMDGEVVEALGATLRLGHVGVYDVTFRAPSKLAAGEHSVRLSMGGVASNEVILLGVDPTGPSIRAIVSAGSFAPNTPVAPGSILSLFVSNAGSETNTALFPATHFAGLSVSFSGIPAPLFAVAPEAGQINVLAPLELPETGEVDVRTITPQGSSGVFPLQMTSASPSIFRINDPSDPSRRFAAALLANTAWLAIPDSVAQALGLPINCAEQGINPASSCGRPLRPGEFVQLFLTGLGRATPNGDPNAPPLTTGQVAPAGGNPLYRTVSLPEVTIGGLRAEVAFSGLAPGFAGLYQINAIVPAAVPPGDTIPIRISTPNGLSDTAIIAVQAP